MDEPFPFKNVIFIELQNIYVLFTFSREFSKAVGQMKNLPAENLNLNYF